MHIKRSFIRFYRIFNPFLALFNSEFEDDFELAIVELCPTLPSRLLKGLFYLEKKFPGDYEFWFLFPVSVLSVAISINVFSITPITGRSTTNQPK